MTSLESSQAHVARVIPLTPRTTLTAPVPSAPVREPLWRHVVGDVLRRERLAQERTLKDVADSARISMPYLSELERGRKEASSEVLAAAAHALGLDLADLLALVQDELARLTRAKQAKTAAVGSPVRRTPVSPRPDRDSTRTVAMSIDTGGSTGDNAGDSGDRAAVASISELGLVRGAARSAAQPASRRTELCLAA